MTDTSRKIATTIINELNTFTFNSKEVAEAMSEKHKTLQQNFTRLCVEWLRLCGSENYLYDGRNEASHEIGKKVAPVLEDACLPFI